MSENLDKSAIDYKTTEFNRSSAKDYLIGCVISAFILGTAVVGIFALETYGIIDVQILKPFYLQPLTTFSTIIVMLLVGVISYIIFYVIGFLIFLLIEKKISLLEFTFILHRKWHGDDDLYFFEYFSTKENVKLKSSLKRSAYGSILVLGIAILIIENFLTIPDLIPYFWNASIFVLFGILITLPFIVIFLFISPLITKEINLYYHNKDDRTVRNVGGWLDDSLKLFAAVDIILVTIIILDSSTITAGWLIFIICLVLAVFALFLVITVLFDRLYHAKLNKMYKDHLNSKYMIPIRKVDLPHRTYYCKDCNAVLDYINMDKCDKCGALITKCVICGDVLEKPEHIFTCSECGAICHKDEMISWSLMRGKCPSCKATIILKR
ncbi:MAG: hypothetical protein ACTSVY_03290 [Candidatus Helarchaeota archaeon]